MKITRSNYESWFLDFLEGNLDPSLTDEFQLFLKENPDLAIELGMGDMILLLTNENICFDAKEELKRSVSDQEIEFQERAVAYYEGDLSKNERIIFEAILSENSLSAADAQQYGKIKLLTDQTIIFENKDQLKKRTLLLPLWMKVASAAAILVLAYLIFQPYVVMQYEPKQLVDDLRNKVPENIAIPETKIKTGVNNLEKYTPAAPPKKIPVDLPVRPKPNPVGPRSGINLTPIPKLRTPETAPALLRPRGISFGQPGDVKLAVMTLFDPIQVSKDMQLAELLKVQLAAMRKSGDRELLSTEHLGLAGLQLFAKLTGKRLTARKGDDGTVRSVSYNSRVLAFSIPVNR